MNWSEVPAYKRPAGKRVDEGLLMPWRWSEYQREVWRDTVEEAGKWNEGRT